MGKVIMSGIVPQMKAPGGILASDLAVGSVVKLIKQAAFLPPERENAYEPIDRCKAGSIKEITGEKYADDK